MNIKEIEDAKNKPHIITVSLYIIGAAIFGTILTARLLQWFVDWVG